LFFRLVRDDRIQPEGGEFGMAVLEAAEQASRDPKRLRELIAQLADPSAEVRYLALVDLRTVGEPAAAALIEALADNQRPAEQLVAPDALVAMGEEAGDPLIATLQAPDEPLQCAAIELLARLESRRALPFLLGLALGQESSPQPRACAEKALESILGGVPQVVSAEDFLARQIDAYLDGKSPRRVDVDGQTTLWTWDAAKRAPAEQRLDGELAARMVAARIARQLYQLAPESASNRRLYLTSLLEAAKTQYGLDAPLPTEAGSAFALAAQAGVDAVEDVLVHALEQQRQAASLAALEVLARIGDERLLASSDGRPRSVAAALQHADRRVRFAALNAIIHWDPQYAYPGSSYLPPTLIYFANTAATRQALIGHPRVATARSLVGILNELGFQPDIAQTGRELIRQAQANPDLEFLLVSDLLEDPPVKEFIQQLRRDPSTARLPIGVLTRRENFDEMQRFTDEDPLSDTLPRSLETSGVVFQVRRLLSLGNDIASNMQRVRRAQVALDYLARLADDRQRYLFYEILPEEDAVADMLYHPALVSRASRVLGYLGSPRAQRALVTLASQNSRDAGQRKAATEAFSEAVQRHGLLLARDDILLQYDRYNQSAKRDAETRRILGTILDVIEAPSQREN
jgi:HEAT repeat protein